MVRVAQGRVILRGHLGDGQDVWNMSFATGALDSLTQAELQELADNTNVLFQAYVWGVTYINERIAAAVTFDGCRLDDVRNPGGVTRSAESTLSPPVEGTAAFSSLPTEVSVVISLRTGLPGPTRRGRMYFPPTAITTCALDGRLIPEMRDALAEGFADFFGAFNDQALVTAPASVASDVGQYLTPVTAVQVGNVFDSQRRRRNGLLESYETFSVP